MGGSSSMSTPSPARGYRRAIALAFRRAGEKRESGPSKPVCAVHATVRKQTGCMLGPSDVTAVLVHPRRQSTESYDAV
jgi:hypothetical protein